jgi:hypothetical protein
VEELKAKIVPLYQNIPNVVRPNLSYDKYAEKKAQQFFQQKNSWLELDMIYLQASNSLEIERSETALEILKVSACSWNMLLQFTQWLMMRTKCCVYCIVHRPPLP